MSAPHEFSEEELAQIEAEMARITVDDVLLQTVVTLLNLAARKAGLATPPGEKAPAPDLAEVGHAIEGARALMPLLERRHAEQLGPIRETLSRLQIAFAQLSGAAAAAPAGAAGEPPAGGEPPSPPAPGEGRGPAQSSGRLWVPGQ
jgi:hypothetical protein